MSDLPRGPVSAVDLLIEMPPGIVIIKRANEPRGWALPGGFVNEGETVEEAAVREAREETSLDIDLVEQFGVYSDPTRDPRRHSLSVVFIARADGVPVAANDAADAIVVPLSAVPLPLCFDHARIVADYVRYRQTGQRPRLVGRGT